MERRLAQCYIRAFSTEAIIIWSCFDSPAKVELSASGFIDAIENQLLIFCQRWMDWINNKAIAKIHLVLKQKSLVPANLRLC